MRAKVQRGFRRRWLLVTTLLLALPACITKAEFKADVGAWRAYYDATKDDLHMVYDVLPEPSRTTRLHLIFDEDQAIRGAEVRAGLREAAPIGSQ